MDAIDITFNDIAAFCFGYPFVMSWYWIFGSLIFYFLKEAGKPKINSAVVLRSYPKVSILLPCHNEEDQIEETIDHLSNLNYPDYEIVAIDDGSTDKTLMLLQQLLDKEPRLRIVALELNQGKSSALNAGLEFSQGEILVCIDGDALLDKNSVLAFVANFLTHPKMGAQTGNPRIRNRSTILGKLQVGEFSSIIGMIKRTQTVFGSLFTVSGVICSFRKEAVKSVGGWNPRALTDDVDLTLRLQANGWSVAFEPNALCWILMPETFRGLWMQRVRWSEGGALAVYEVTKKIFSFKDRKLLVIWANFFVSAIWAYLMLLCLVLWVITSVLHVHILGLDPFPEWWGVVLAMTYLLQAAIGLLLDSRYERSVLKHIFWVIWYPIIFWLIQMLCAVAGTYKAFMRRSKLKGTWVSPDRGYR
jgi:biofilm PGA synthesis N-glycosyltransferase PgaC